MRPNPPTNRAIEQFRTLVSRPDDDLDLAAAALALAGDDYPDMEPAPYLAQLDRLATRAREQACGTEAGAGLAAFLCDFLFRRLGFTGNVQDFYDPRNSFLNEVLSRRLGIPITLSVLCLEVAWRLGLPLQGIAFPGRFLVGLLGGEEPVVFDPYGGGTRLSAADIRQLLAQVYRQTPVDEDLVRRHLVAARKKTILVRMLRNLKGIYAARQRHEKTLACIERLLILVPEEPREIRDRGLVLHKLEAATAARADLLRYLELAPRAAEAKQIRTLIAELEAKPSRLN